MRKYLEDIGIKDDTWDHAGDSRREMWAKQREVYGFDDSETWDVRYNFRAWLFEHVSMYLELADQVVDLSYHKFDYKDKQYTQKEMILMLLEELKKYLQDEVNYEDEYPSKIEEIWMLVSPAMWW